MNKKILAGALVLGASTMFGLVGCGENKDKTVEEVAVASTYTVTFDDNNTATEDVEVQFKQGDVELSSVPSCPTKDGFAGIWDSYTLGSEDIVVKAKYGDGTENNPYMIDTTNQFSYMIKHYATDHSSEYKNGSQLVAKEDVNGNFTTSTGVKLTGSDLEIALNSATSKTEFYKTCSVTYVKDDAWKMSAIDIGTKVYFKLISDIDISSLQGQSNGGRFINASIDGLKEDGGRYQLLGVNGDKFRNTEGAIFNNMVGNSTISNIDVKFGAKKNLASLVGCVRKGVVNLENISTSVTNGGQVFINSADDNESPFVRNVLGEDGVGAATLNMTNCVNNANIISTAKNFGIFVGGYAMSASKVNFDRCVNNASVISSGMVGVFFGNNFATPKSYTIKDCENNGMITTHNYANSHVLVADVMGTSCLGTTSISIYDNDSSIQNSSIEALSTRYTLGRGSDVDLIVENSGLNVDKGIYELTISALATTSELAIRTNINFVTKLDTATESLTFENVLYGMIDVNTYKSEFAIESISESVEWKNVEGYDGIKYFLDTEKGYYVFDYSEFERKNTISPLTLNVSAQDVEVIVVVKSLQQSIVNFVVG